MAQIDPHSYTDLNQGQIRHIDMNLHVDFSSRTIEGDATYTFLSSSSGELHLDTRDLTVLSVKDSEGNDLPFSMGTPDNVLGTCLIIQRNKPLEKLTVSYKTSPQASALQWLSPNNTAGKKHPFLLSQCQPHHARSMIPVQDSPKVRFSYAASVTVPTPLSAVMSASPGEKVETNEQSTTFRFHMPQPIPSYLLAIAVGNITGKDLGPRTKVYAEPETVDQAAWEFEPIESMLKEAEKLFGPYLWERFDFIVLPPAFPYGGMENPRLTFLTPTLLAGDRSLVNVLAHELAHSWTGNLVTNATMDDFWLNEGFTVWAERRILEALEGKEAVSLSAAIGRNDLKEDMELFGMDSPFTKLKNDLKGIDPDEIYSQVPYEKGFLFVALMEKTMGREKWDQFLATYLDRFKFQSISTEDFVRFLEEQNPELLEATKAKQWIYEPGLPENAPVFESKRLEDLLEKAKNWENGVRVSKEETSSWAIPEWLVYLGELPKKMSPEDCAWLDQTYGFNQSGNAEILAKWLEIAATSTYEPAFDKIREFLPSMGRMKFLKPLYRALYTNPQTKNLAMEIFEGSKEQYHPIARGGLERILEIS